MSKRSMILLAAAGTALLASGAQAACDSASGDGPLSVVLGEPMRIGRIVVPDSGDTKVLQITAQDDRILPPELNINDQNRSNFTDVFGAAEIEVAGGAGCFFLLTLSAVDPRVGTITYDAVGQTLTDQGGGKRGALNGAPVIVRIGAHLSVSGTDTSVDFTNATLFKADVIYVD